MILHSSTGLRPDISKRCFAIACKTAHYSKCYFTRQPGQCQGHLCKRRENFRENFVVSNHNGTFRSRSRPAQQCVEPICYGLRQKTLSAPRPQLQFQISVCRAGPTANSLRTRLRIDTPPGYRSTLTAEKTSNYSLSLCLIEALAPS